MQELLSKASKASKAFEAKHGREPTPEELAPELGVEASRIRDAWDAVSAPRSLDQPMGADADGGTLGDVVEVRGCRVVSARGWCSRSCDQQTRSLSVCCCCCCCGCGAACSQGPSQLGHLYSPVLTASLTPPPPQHPMTRPTGRPHHWQ